MSDLAQLMEEPPGGSNHGRRFLAESYAQEGASAAQRAGLPLGVAEAQAVEFMTAGGWTIVHEKDGSRAGVSSHGTNQHTVLHPDEYVDHEAVLAAVEHELGFTAEAVRSVYRQGPLSSDQRELRRRLDARLLALSRSGAQMALLGRVLGLQVKADGHCRAIENALTRARTEEGT